MGKLCDIESGLGHLIQLFFTGGYPPDPLSILGLRPRNILGVNPQTPGQGPQLTPPSAIRASP